MEFNFLLQGLKSPSDAALCIARDRKRWVCLNPRRTSSEEPRAAASVFQTMGVLDAAYGILYDFLWQYLLA